MKRKHNAKRSDFNDSAIMDALDQSEYNISKAASTLGLIPGTLRNWILNSDNLSKYIALKQADGALRAREKLEYIMDHLDCLDPRSAGIVVNTCKILMDKYEPDLLKSSVDQRIEVNQDLEDKIKKLLEE